MGRGGTKPTEQSHKEGMGRDETKPTEQSAYRVPRRGWGGVGPNPLNRVPIECQGGDGEGWDQTH